MWDELSSLIFYLPVLIKICTIQFRNIRSVENSIYVSAGSKRFMKSLYATTTTDGAIRVSQGILMGTYDQPS